MYSGASQIRYLFAVISWTMRLRAPHHLQIDTIVVVSREQWNMELKAGPPPILREKTLSQK